MFTESHANFSIVLPSQQENSFFVAVVMFVLQFITEISTDAKPLRFDKMPTRDLISYNTAMSACARRRGEMSAPGEKTVNGETA